MKKILLLSILLLEFYSINATVLTVSNDPNQPAQYSDVEAAIEGANPGDTLYLHGSVKVYGTQPITISKPIVIIGTGYNPKKESPLTSKVNLGQLTGDEVNGSKLIGLIIQGPLGIVNTDNILIQRCKVSSISVLGSSEKLVSGIVIAENFIRASLIINNINEISIRNNIIGTNGIRASESIKVGIYNNVFIGNGVGGNSMLVTNAIIANNIFYGASPTGATNSTFNSNIIFKAGVETFPEATNSGSNNLLDTDPEFTNFTFNDFSKFDNYEFDYRLKSSSPGKNGGTDGKDIGLYGGQGFNPTGEPSIPQIREFTILNSLVPQNGMLNIQIKASTVK